MDKMAVNNPLPWRSPLSLNLIRDNDCFDQGHSDMFQNLEKLIASAVSICRLDGSLQCQIGGLITVIEELQRLLRHSFAEIKRLEKTIDNQKRNNNGNISNLNKQIKDLQSSIDSKRKLHDFTSQVFAPQGDNVLMRRYSWNGERFVFQAGKNINQSDESQLFNISLVDESYGNEEESDNSIPNIVIEEDKEMENTNVEDSVDQENGLDHSLDASHEEEEEENVNEENASENEKASSLEAVVKVHLDNTSEEIVGHISGHQIIDSSTKETTPDAIEETDETSRNLRKSSGSNTPSKNQSRRESLVRSPRIHAKPNENRLVDRSRAILSEEKARRSKNQGSLFGGRSTKVDQTQQKSVAEKRSSKVAQSCSHTPNGGTKGKRTSSKDNGTHISQTKAPVRRANEKPMDKYINLDFLLMVNQVMSDLVSHVDREEAALDEVKGSERKDVMNLAKLYRLRVRMAGKCDQALPVVLVKGRESCLPKPGEVDSLLSAMSDTSANKMQASLLKISGNKHRLKTETNISVGRKSKKRRI